MISITALLTIVNLALMVLNAEMGNVYIALFNAFAAGCCAFAAWGAPQRSRGR